MQMIKLSNLMLDTQTHMVISRSRSGMQMLSGPQLLAIVIELVIEF